MVFCSADDKKTKEMVSESDLEKDLSRKTVVVTGGNSGIGRETAKQLFKQGATVVIGSRKVENGEGVAAELKKEGMAESEVEKRFSVIQLDLADLDTVRAFVDTFKEKHTQLHILVNNAGIANTKYGHTKQGFELQMGTNHIGHFLLTNLLLDMLSDSGSYSDPSRVITVSSAYATGIGMKCDPFADIDFNDFNWKTRGPTAYDGWVAYGQSKLANVLHVMSLAERVKHRNIVCVSLHPGMVRTNIFSGFVPSFVTPAFLFAVGMMTGQKILSPWEGAQTSLHCCLVDSLESGAHYASPSSLPLYPKGAELGWPCSATPFPQWTKENADNLWRTSEESLKALQ